MPKVLNFKVIIEQDEDGVFVASVPAIPGCHTQGSSYEEVIEMAHEAIELCLEIAKDDPEYKSRIMFPKKSSSSFLGIVSVPVATSIVC